LYSLQAAVQERSLPGTGEASNLWSEENALKMTKLAAAIALLAIANSCSDPVDKAAKRRIFSPEDPPQVVASSAEKLDPGALGDQAQLARRVLRMGAAEAIERLGPHRFTATVSLAWTGGDQTEELKEKRALTAGAGGVAGDFHASLENSRDQGLEVIRVHNAVYARSRYGKFRQRLRDRGMAEKERDEVYSALRDFDAVFNGRLKLVSAGQVSIRGRTAIRYAASLAPPEKAAPSADAGLPKIAVPKGGVDDSTARRIAFVEKRQPKSVQGEVAVDSKTAVVLESHLEGMLAIPSPDGKEATLKMIFETAVADIGKDPGIKAPAEFLPDADKPAGIAAALDRFGIPHGAGQKKDAGAEADPAEEEER
jgi:hypothetical protein